MRWVIRDVLAVGLLLALAGAVEARDYFGALSYSRTTRAHGYANDQPTREDAEAAAITACSDLATDCEAVMWFGNACGALAVGPDGWGSHWDVSQQGAEKKALDACKEYSKDCVVVRWVCTTR